MVAKAKFGKTPSRDKHFRSYINIKCSPGSYPEIKVDEIDKYSRTIQCVYHILVPLNKGIIIDHNEIQLQTHYQIKKITDHKVHTALPVWEQSETEYGFINMLKSLSSGSRKKIGTL